MCDFAIVSKRAFIILLAVVAVIAFAFVYAASVDASTRHPVREVAARIAPGANVTCEPLPGLYGDSWRDDEGVHIRLSPPTCSGLRRLAEHRIRNWENSANALETLLHERDHWPAGTPDGVEDEGIVDCRALASMPYWLHRLGYHGAQARRLMRAAWSVHVQLSSAYDGPCVSPYLELVPVARP